LHPGQQDAAGLFTRKDVDRFASHDWIEMSTGAPLLANALIALDCRLDRAVDGFSHTILIGIVEQLSCQPETDQDCLVWHRRRYRRSADL
jgi:flavin reductase